MINNDYSGTLNIQNLNHINSLYEMMKEALIVDNNTNYPNTNPGGMIFATINQNTTKNHIFATSNSQKGMGHDTRPNRLFSTVKGKKIFNIVKEPNLYNRRKTIKIIYKQEEDSNNLQRNYNFGYEEDSNEIKEEYHPIKDDRYEENREEDYDMNEAEENDSLKQEDNHEGIFESNFSFLNMFK